MDKRESILQNKLVIKKKESYYLINIEDVLYFTAHNNKILVISDDEYTYSSKLYNIEKTYYEYGFIRVNKSQIVNIQKVKRIDPCIGSRLILIMENNDNIIVTKSYIKRFKHYIGI